MSAIKYGGKMNIKRIKPKTIFALLLGIFIGITVTSCVVDPYSDDNRDNRFSATESFSFQINIDQQNRLTLSGINGSVEVTGSTANTGQVEIRGEKSVESDSRGDAEAALRNLSVGIDETADSINVRTEQPKNTGGRNYLVHYHITLPRDWQVDVDHLNGEVVLKNIGNNLTARNENGNMSLIAVEGTTQVELTNGNIDLHDLSGSVHATLINGNIDADVEMAPGGSIELGIINGNVSLDIPKNISASFSAQTKNGGINLNNLSLQNSSTGNNLVTGTLGDGSGKIVLGTVNGSITVRGI